jgi:hypothetical protein
MAQPPYSHNNKNKHFILRMIPIFPPSFSLCVELLFVETHVEVKWDEKHPISCKLGKDIPIAEISGNLIHGLVRKLKNPKKSKMMKNENTFIYLFIYLFIILNSFSLT